ncbi:MAG: hypothetical protein KKD01_00220 [Proteobacteria bacterium]|nr:hypothetical protein [Pseudomonadota bacterium]MBU1231928.1 hypothetical protein [Pseudomonadota bacterium]MBU1417532.1 hypothetical protein [Pseudomonadota bacterium]MBU1453121.1 hypothetical protein [Pseudomonadota bacterium]
MTNTEDTHQTLPLERARWTLAKLWFVGAGLVFLILVGQSIAGKYQDKTELVWSWALPTVMPTLSLIVTVLGASALQKQLDVIAVRRSFYTLSLWLSVIYLALILLTLGLEPFSTLESLELLNLSNLWLAPFQGLVISALGVLFFTQSKK